MTTGKVVTAFGARVLCTLPRLQRDPWKCSGANQYTDRHLKSNGWPDQRKKILPFPTTQLFPFSINNLFLTTVQYATIFFLLRA